MAVKVMVAPAIVDGSLEKSARTAVRKPGKAAPKPKRRRSSVYDADGNEVFITLVCLKCHRTRPLSQFGLRKMTDGAIRNQPWCRSCRSGTGAQKARTGVPAATEGPVAAEAPPATRPDAAPDVSSLHRPASSMAAEVAAALAAGLRR